MKTEKQVRTLLKNYKILQKEYLRKSKDSMLVDFQAVFFEESKKLNTKIKLLKLILK